MGDFLTYLRARLLPVVDFVVVELPVVDVVAVVLFEGVDRVTVVLRLCVRVGVLQRLFTRVFEVLEEELRTVPVRLLFRVTVVVVVVRVTGAVLERRTVARGLLVLGSVRRATVREELRPLSLYTLPLPPTRVATTLPVRLS